MNFSDWITKKYIAWRGDAIGNARSITEFAKLIGVPQSLMSQWMKKGGKVPTSQKYILALVNQYGDEVYQVLGIAKPETQLSRFDQTLLRLYHALPPQDQEEIYKQLESKNGDYQPGSLDIKTKPA